MEIASNSKLIRDLIKDIKPETVVLEMCQDRYDHWFYDAISHPNYDRTLSDVHKILDSGKVADLLDYKGLEMAKSSAHLEYLVGLDVCSYRMMPCKTVFGDRSIKITNKRYRSKVKMLEVYKEQLELATQTLDDQQSTSKKSSNIFDLDSTTQDSTTNSDPDQISRLRSALKDLQA